MLACLLQLDARRLGQQKEEEPSPLMGCLVLTPTGQVGVCTAARKTLVGDANAGLSRPALPSTRACRRITRGEYKK